MSGPVLRIDSTHSSLDCYIGSILLALSSIRADRRGTYQPTPDRGRPSVPTLQPPPHTVRPRMRLQANFLRPLRLFVPSLHAACTSWLLSTFQHHVRPRLGPSIQSLYSIGSQLDYFFPFLFSRWHSRKARTTSCTLFCSGGCFRPVSSSPLPCPSTSTCQPTVPVTASTVGPKERYQNSSKTVDHRHDHDTTRRLPPTHSPTRPVHRPSQLFRSRLILASSSPPVSSSKSQILKSATALLCCAAALLNLSLSSPALRLHAPPPRSAALIQTHLPGTTHPPPRDLLTFPRHRLPLRGHCDHWIDS